MLANAVFVATLLLLALGFGLMHELGFLAPWRDLILYRYSGPIALYGALLFENLLGVTLWIERKFFLRDAGRKLTHLDQEILSGHNALSQEILSQFPNDHQEEP